MPGFLLSVNAIGDYHEQAEQALLMQEDYIIESLHQDRYCALSMHVYPSYPFQKFVYKNVTIVFEGLVYNYAKPELASIFTSFFSPTEIFTEKIREWVMKADGEFVLLIIHHGLREILIVNDSWGRLPVYYATKNNTIIVSREIGFLTRMQTTLQPNRMATAMYMLFGYPLGQNTLWEGIQRLPPHSFLHIDLRKRASTFSENFKLPSWKNQIGTDKDQINTLFELLKSATLTRCRFHSGLVLSLSGGLDSRLLAGIIAQHLSTANFITYREPGGSTQLDAIAVKQIIDQLDMTDRHRFVQIKETGESEAALLLHIKQGLNYLGMAFLIPYLQKLREEELIQMTGDGGDKLLADIRPLYAVKTEKQLLRYLLRSNGLMTLSQLYKITGIKPDETSEYIIGHLQSYGRLSMEENHSRFLILERGMNWLFEGEDRNRYFGWSTSPYYHPELAHIALSIHPKQKEAGKLFHEFFLKLPGQLSHIINPNWKLPPSETAAIRKMLWRQSVKLRLPSSILQWHNKSVFHENTFLEESLQRSPKNGSLPDWFRYEAVKDMPVLSTDAKWNLLTLKSIWENKR